MFQRYLKPRQTDSGYSGGSNPNRPVKERVAPEGVGEFEESAAAVETPPPEDDQAGEGNGSQPTVEPVEMIPAVELTRPAEGAEPKPSPLSATDLPDPAPEPEASEAPEEELPDDIDVGEDDDQQQWRPVARPVPPPAHDRFPRPRHNLEKLRKLHTPRKQTSSKGRVTYTPEQRLLILDTWQRSGLSAGDFAELVLVSKHTLYKWKKDFEKFGPEGLMDRPRQPREGSRLSEVTKRAILMMKQAHPEWGVERIADMMMRGPGMTASPSAISRFLKESGYETVERPTRPNPALRVKRFERARPNQLWQTDLFTFVLKRQNRRLYLVAFMDDFSRFIVSFGLHASGTTPLVIEVLESGIANYGPPEEVLTDNGPQFHTWRGKSKFTRQLEKRGIKQIVARPKRPQTLGKIERFWGTMWRELLEGSVFTDLGDARQRIGHFIDYYNFQRTHRGIGGQVPADRYFSASEEVKSTLKQRVAANALELARQGKPNDPFYVTGQVSGQAFSVHTEGERLVLNREGQEREEIELARRDPNEQVTGLPEPVCPQGIVPSAPGEPAEREPLPPGQSALDELGGEEVGDE